MAGCFGAFVTFPLEPNISHSIQTILIIAFLLSLTIFVAKLSSGFVTLFGQKTQSVSASIISNLTRITVFIFGILIILQTVGVKITPILTTLGVGGLAIALAVQDTLSNLFAGLYLIISQQFKTGDYVKLETNQEGYVIDINWRSTTIKDISNNIIIIPNSKLSSVIFTNYHLPVKEVVLRVDLGVGYASNLEYVEQITIEVAKEVMAEIAPELTINEPFIRY
ncbi:mechanosensitive ion channel family protein, partial [Brunnivagina elsteri]|uniref:mechanosensitive ion channel family protein n=1 Tax=Brunnivagina elsteri TaxID=1247191 RepID=UPI003184287D